ncbi:EpsG family protein [Aequorivita echinoideorum]|uniref:EpsG family protein n=2 Tax=Aequorivita echinoideorum TaxID=1549647 RepID=A0ABS5S3Z8_9FLAO|nr:EpsG family protein [Aequorivita echinoideorum]
MGLRPISGKYFGDMATYNLYFEHYGSGQSIIVTKDIFFHYFMKYSSRIMPASLFFLLCSIIYIYPLYLISKKWFKEYWYYSFLFFVCSFSFWAYGTNGIRNGIAGSIFLLGISRDKRIWQVIWIFLAINFHKSMLLPALGFLIVQFYNNPRYYIIFWLICIPLSLISGGFWENLFSNIGFDDDRLSYLTQGNINDDDFSSIGFRWDFLLYSGTAIFAGYYYIILKKYKDKIYYWLFNTYVIANAFWILIIRANFSNRFAYLSWFMIALIIAYPMLKAELFDRQHIKLSNMLILYFLFTFIMNVFLLN